MQDTFWKVKLENIVHTPYLPGADAALHERMVSLIPSLGSFANTPFGSAAGTAPAFAKGLLKSARTGLVTPRFGIEGAAS